jgi:hypothetical protein
MNIEKALEKAAEKVSTKTLGPFVTRELVRAAIIAFLEELPDHTGEWHARSTTYDSTNLPTLVVPSHILTKLKEDKS